MLCPQGHPLPPTGFTARFCPTCGSELINPCPVGHDNSAGARFCRECGRSMVRPTGTPSTPTAVLPPVPTGILAPETTAVVRPRGSTSTTAVVRPTGSVAATTAVVRPAGPAAATTQVVPAARSGGGSSPRSVRSGTSTEPPVAPSPGDDETRPAPTRNRGLLVAIVALAVAVVAVVIAALATSLGNPTHPTAPLTPPTTGPPSTTAPPPSSTTTTLSAQALPQGQALTALLAQSSGNRNQVQAATQAIAACGDLAQAQATLSGAQAARQSLLSQLDQLDLAALPRYTALTSSLADAWQSSANSDASYAQWAADEQAKPCVTNDTGNSNYQAALAADGRASTAKQQFTSLWDPVAGSLGLQQWQPAQL